MVRERNQGMIYYMKIDKIIRCRKDKAFLDFHCDNCSEDRKKFEIKEGDIYYLCWGYNNEYKDREFYSFLCKRCYKLLRLKE